jgi:hypothetical protein
MLLLNDGMIRAISWGESLGLFDLGSWLRHAVLGHYSVRRDEYANGLPGPRTVISSGWVAEHSFPEVRLDDYALSYIMQQPGTSNLSEIMGNPLLVSNPLQLQLNTAFSRSYLLDQAGSRAGLSGACLYLDEQFIDDVTALFQSNLKFRVNKWTRENDILFAVEYIDSIKQTPPVDPNKVLTKDEWARRCQEEEEKVAKRGYRVLPDSSGLQPWVFGFLLETPAIKVDLPSLKTIVYRVLGFFPFDEDPTEFMFELWPTDTRVDR